MKSLFFLFALSSLTISSTLGHEIVIVQVQCIFGGAWQSFGQEEEEDIFSEILK